MRIPYSMPGEIIMQGNQSGTQFADVTFTNNIDMPFEAHRMIPRIVGLDDANNMLATQPSQEQLQELVRARINDFGKNVIMTKNPAFFNTLVKGSSERTWEWADPYYLIRSEGFQVVCDTVTLPVFDGNQIPVAPPTVPLVSLRIEVTFQGFLLQVAPPSNTR
ncbi:MAG: hypothetical protein ACREJC_03980 [Tepidisphaeraceae bacterium]